MIVSSSLKRLKLCSLPRLERMSEAISAQIKTLEDRVWFLERKCESMAKDDQSVRLHLSHGEFHLEFDRFEYEIDCLQRNIENLQERRSTVEEVRMAKSLLSEQASILGSKWIVKFKDSILFVLILLVLSLLAIETYKIGASGRDAEIQLILTDGKISDTKIINSGQDYSAAEIIISGQSNKKAYFSCEVKDGQLAKVKVLMPGAGYDESSVATVIPGFSNATLWSFWIVDTLCCVVFLLNFIFELRLAESKKWYWKRHWIDFITSIPLPPIHLFVGAAEGANLIRLGRIFRVIRILRTIRVLRMFLFLWRGLDHFSTIMNVKLLKRSLIYGFLAMFMGALLFMAMEKIKGGEGTFIESLWWSFTTLVTGGFADIHNPSTMGGKILTVMLVIGGMVLVGVFTATLTSVLVKDDDSWQKLDMDEQIQRLGNLEKSLESIDRRLGAMETDLSQEDKK